MKSSTIIDDSWGLLNYSVIVDVFFSSSTIKGRLNLSWCCGCSSKRVNARQYRVSVVADGWMMVAEPCSATTELWSTIVNGGRTLRHAKLWGTWIRKLRLCGLKLSKICWHTAYFIHPCRSGSSLGKRWKRHIQLLPAWGSRIIRESEYVLCDTGWTFCVPVSSTRQPDRGRNRVGPNCLSINLPGCMARQRCLRVPVCVRSRPVPSTYIVTDVPHPHLVRRDDSVSDNEIRAAL